MGSRMFAVFAILSATVFGLAASRAVRTIDQLGRLVSRTAGERIWMIFRGFDRKARFDLGKKLVIAC